MIIVCRIRKIKGKLESVELIVALEELSPGRLMRPREKGSDRGAMRIDRSGRLEVILLSAVVGHTTSVLIR